MRVEELHRVPCDDGFSLADQAAPDLHQAAGISRRDDRRARFHYPRELGREDLLGDVGAD
ncbi:hypothetical protein D3C83_172880 [compost metagenome]